MKFDEHFSQELAERWPKLKAALQSQPTKVALSNPFFPEAEAYELDESSLWAAQNLKIKENSQVLDMCAAPGGKALSLIFAVKAKANFTLNDVSHGRLQRLKRVLRQQLPVEAQENINVTKHDASRWGLYEPNQYDSILLDAPCSGERHMSATDREKWSIKSSKSLAHRQYALLCAAIMSLKPGGEVLYSTCSISKFENDEVIKKFLQKKPGQAEVLIVEAAQGEKTEFGWQVWPDHCGGRGPLYFAKLKKLE